MPKAGVPVCWPVLNLLNWLREAVTMTQAICFNCGELKFGAFVECKKCSTRPRTDDEFVLSLAMTDHYFDLLTLGKMGDSVKSGNPPKLDDETRKNLLTNLAEIKAQPIWSAIAGGSKPTSEPTKKRWKFW